MDTHIFVNLVKLKPNCLMVFNLFSVSMAQYIKTTVVMILVGVKEAQGPKLLRKMS